MGATSCCRAPPSAVQPRIVTLGNFTRATVLLLTAAMGCGGTDTGGGPDAATVDANTNPDAGDSSTADAAPHDAAAPSDATQRDALTVDGRWDASTTDAQPFQDAATPRDATAPPLDATATPLDATAPPLDATATPDATPGVISGGPCISGAPGMTAYRIRWAGSGGTAYVMYEVNGLPDTSRDHAAAYGYQIPFSPSWVDTSLGEGGLQLNGSSFVDIELSTAGIAAIDKATLSIYGRSYNVGSSGSFNWQTFSGTGAAPTNLVSNSTPYTWYSADMTSALAAGDDGVLLRIKAGPSSGSLAVHRIELCVQAR